VDRTIIQELLEVVEQAAIASAHLTGHGKKNEADQAAVEAMRQRMGLIAMQGRIVIGEGERDEAPML
jgi:fructose-1,6-bisphosphatase II / sedoheptulose-1,7-bisphosphatase